jgi:hypothetical protein
MIKGAPMVAGFVIRRKACAVMAAILVSVAVSVSSGQTQGVWSGLGTGMDATVQSLVVDSAGTLYAGGNFSFAGAVTANRVAAWSGTQWQPLNTGIGGYNPVVYALASPHPGTVYAGGSFSIAGSAQAGNIAYWNGQSWQQLGSSSPDSNGTNGTVAAIFVNGSDVYVGGSFTKAGGVPARNVARWDGTGWHAIGSGCNNLVYSFAMYGGMLYAAGAFDSAGTHKVNYVARWNGTDWVAVSTGMDFYVYSLMVVDTVLYAGGAFSRAGGIQTGSIARWNGTSWSGVGGGVNSTVQSIVRGPSGIYAGGLFTIAGGQPVNLVAKWNGTTWTPMGGGVDSWVLSLAASRSDVYVGGAFTVAGSQPASRIARWREGVVSTQAVVSGWNLVSLPAIPTSVRPDSVFPGYITIAGFQNSTQSYTTPTSLQAGYGYWAYYGSSRSVTIVGASIDTIAVPVAKSGWQLIGCTSSVSPAGAISSSPSSIVSGPYRFNGVTQLYETISQFTPGEGYWVFVSQPCTIKLPK